MRAAVRSLICIALIAVLLTLPQTRQANAESNSAVASNGSALTAPSGNEANRPAEPAHHKGSHAQPKEKKTSFVNKMRDKAMAKMQKFFGKKQELQPSAKQIPKQDVE